MTLNGRRIVVTRARHQSEEICNLIEQAGGIPVLYPCIAIAPPQDTFELDLALRNIQDFDWMIFTSPNTVNATRTRLDELQLMINWQTIRVAAIGDKTSDTFEKLSGRPVDFVASHHTAETLAREMALPMYQKILLPQSALADNRLYELLTERGAIVSAIKAYQNGIGTGGEDVPALLKQNQIDAITFTSASTVTNFVKRIAPLEAFDIPVICIGSSTYEVAVEAGFQRVYYPENYTIPDMIELLSSHFDEVEHGNT